MSENTVKQADAAFHRFQVFQGNEVAGLIKKTKSVGMAYLKEGQQTLTMRLWTFVNERFYLILNDRDTSKYLVMTREPNKNPKSKNKYFWNIVGNGQIESAKGIVRIELDLFDKPIFMNIYPEPVAQSANLPNPDFANDAA